VLWYKAWLETRARFLTCLTVLTVFCAFFIHHAQGFLHPGHPGSKTDFNRLLYIAQVYVVFVWILSVVLLGMGGLIREKSTGTSLLTLSLPVSRAHLLWARIAVGVLEAVSLAVVPWATIFLVSSAGGMPVQLRQVGFYVLLLVGGGLVYFAMAVLVSSLVEGEYTAPAVAFGLVFLSAILFDAWLRRFNLWRLVTGDFYLDRSTYLLAGRFPWTGIIASLCVAAALLFASINILEKREF
jgi:ABC-type transport system involved in multi-copper enzyme maturation permease subunit